MAHHAPVQEDPQELARARQLWAKAMTITKYSIAVVVVILLGLASAFVTF